MTGSTNWVIIAFAKFFLGAEFARLAGSNGAANVTIFLLIRNYVSKLTIDFLILAAVTSLYKPCEMGGFEAVLFLAGAAGLYLWNLSKAAGSLVYYPGNITGFSLSGFSPVVTADLIVQNTSNISFTITSLAGNVTTNGTQVGNISNFTPIIIPANSQGAIPLTLTLQPIGAANEIIAIITGGVGSRDIKIDGSINANGIQQPLALSYKVGV